MSYTHTHPHTPPHIPHTSCSCFCECKDCGHFTTILENISQRKPQPGLQHIPCLWRTTDMFAVSVQYRIHSWPPQIWVYATSVFLVFTVTISLFPAVLSSIKSTSPDAEASPWTGEEASNTRCCHHQMHGLHDLATDGLLITEYKPQGVGVVSPRNGRGLTGLYHKDVITCTGCYNQRAWHSSLPNSNVVCHHGLPIARKKS